MADYERINFKKKWTDKVRQHLEDNPEGGFEPDEVKEFVKFVLNKYMEGSIGLTEKEILQMLKGEEDVS